MDKTLDIPDDVLTRILRLARSPTGQSLADILFLLYKRDGRKDALPDVCQQWRRLLLESYQSICINNLMRGMRTMNMLDNVAPSVDVDAALSVLQACRNVTHVRVPNRQGVTTPRMRELLRRLAAMKNLPKWTSFDLVVTYRDILEELPYFFSHRTTLRVLELSFSGVITSFDSWERLHACMEDLDFGSLLNLEHLTLDYGGLYNTMGSVGIFVQPSAGSFVPLSRTLVARQEQQQDQPSCALKTFHLKLSNEFQAQILPPWLKDLQLQNFSLSIGDMKNNFLFRSLAAMSTLQMLNLSIETWNFSVDDFASLADLCSLRELHLDVHSDSGPMPKPTRIFRHPEKLGLRLFLPASIPHLFFSFTPDLVSLEVQCHDMQLWPSLAPLKQLTSLRIQSLGSESKEDQKSTIYCDAGDLPALKQLELNGCRWLHGVAELLSLGNIRAFTLHCFCQGRFTPAVIRTREEYVRAQCQNMTPDMAKGVFQDTTSQIAPVTDHLKGISLG